LYVPRNGDFGIGILHYSFDGVPSLSNNSPNKIVVRQNLKLNVTGTDFTATTSVILSKDVITFMEVY